MKKSILFILGIMIIIISNFCGCQEDQTIENKFENINFLSEEMGVLQLVNGSFILDANKHGVVKSAEATVYFKNLLENTIDITFSIDFVDNNDTIIYNKSKTIENLPGGYTEHLGNNFYYDGENVGLVNHINIRIIDYKIKD